MKRENLGTFIFVRASNKVIRSTAPLETKKSRQKESIREN